MSIRAEDQRKTPFIWFDIELDDIGLTPHEMRVYIHVVRRAGRDGKCWESLAKMAAHCGIGLATTKRALKKLVEAGMLGKEPRSGETALYSVADKSNWAKQGGSSETTQVISDTGGSSERSGGVAHSELGGSSEMTYKEDPSKKIPKEERSLTIEDEFEKFFWPDAVKKTGKQYALKAYRKARESTDLDVIVEAWQSAVPIWLKMKQEGRGEYIPNPSTWLNQARWNDPIEEIDPAAKFGRAETKASQAPLSPLATPGWYQGSAEFLEDRPWIEQWRRVNPVYNEGFVKWCISKLQEIDYFSTKEVTIATVKRYLHKGNHDTPDSTQRAGDIAVWWEEYQQESDKPRIIYEVYDSPIDIALRGGIPS